MSSTVRIPQKLAKAAPYLTVFFSSACIMTVELVAGRIISKYLGMSLYTWTAIIGVIMGGMALGNHLGGKLADRSRPAPALAILFFLSAAGCALILPLNNFLGGIAAFANLSWPLRIFFHVALAFFAPATLLGTINPLVAKMALNMSETSGRAIGSVFAWSVAGSIVGTFLTGFYLVFALGATQIVLSMSASLAVLGLIYVGSLRWAAYRPMEQEISIANETKPGAVGPRALWGPYATVFVSNAAFMMLELAGSRLVAHQFGSSLYTWTTLIGVVLAGITLGNYAGGRLADRFASRRLLAIIFLLSSVTCLASYAISAWLNTIFESTFFIQALPWTAQILLYIAACFFVPCVIIGTISPIVVVLELNRGHLPGQTVGSVYAWGAIGSIVATFLTGFFLIGWIGTLSTIVLVAALLTGASVCYAPRAVWSLTWAGATVAAALFVLLKAPADTGAIYEDESNYSYLAVKVDPENPNIRHMLLDKLVHSQVDLENPMNLQYEYEWVYEGVLNLYYPAEEPFRALVIGGGGYTFPRYLELARPNSYVEVAEIDPVVTEIAYDYFGLPRDTAIQIYDMDARNRITDLMRLRETNPEAATFDAIFGDSINDYAVPYHLTTVELTQDIYDLLEDDGMYLLNLIDLFDSGKFLAAVLHTCRQVFPHVYVFTTGRPFSVRDTFIVISSKRPLDLVYVAKTIELSRDFSGGLLKQSMLDDLIDRNGELLLTDNYAPVENLLAPVVAARRTDTGELNFTRAKQFAASGDTDKAIRATRAALRAHRTWPDAEEFLSDLLLQQGDVQGAIGALQNVTTYHQEPATAYFNLSQLYLPQGMAQEGADALMQAIQIDPNHPSANFYLGKAAFARQRYDDAIDYWTKATTNRPDYVEALYNVGLAHAAKSDLDAAIEVWQRTLRIDASYADCRNNLLLAYTLTEDFDNAWSQVEALRELDTPADPQYLEILQKASGRTQ